MQFSPIAFLHLQLSMMLLLCEEPGTRHLSQNGISHLHSIDTPSHHALPSTLVVGQLGWIGEWIQLDINSALY